MFALAIALVVAISPPQALLGQELVVGQPVPIVVESPDDLANLWKRLVEPDFVLLDGKSYRELLSKSATITPKRPNAIIDTIEVSGDIFDDRANLTFVFEVTLVDPIATWVPLKLTSQALSVAREGSNDIPTRYIGATGWEVELRGIGKHRVVVSFVTTVRVTTEGRRLELSIPEVASTNLRLVVDDKLASASVGTSEPLLIESIEGDQRRRLVAKLAPRSQITLDWKLDDRNDVELKPWISAQGQIALSVSLAELTAKTNWEVQALRGEVDRLRLQLAESEELLSLEVDGGKRDGVVDKAGVLEIELARPITTSQSVKLSCVTRSPLPALPATISFRGHRILEAQTQSGLVAVRPLDELWVRTSVGPLMRQIDPKSELPDELRNQPGKLIGFLFTDQPFNLKLQVESLPAVVSLSQATSIEVGTMDATVSTWLDFLITQGRLFEASVVLGPGLELTSIGPPELVKSSRLLPKDDGTTELQVQLTALTRESGKARVRLEGRARVSSAAEIPAGSERSVGIFYTKTPSTREHRISIKPPLGKTIRIPANSHLQFDTLTPFEDSQWPNSRAGDSTNSIMLRTSRAAERLEFMLDSFERRIQAESKLDIFLTPESAEITQRISLSELTSDRIELIADPKISANLKIDGEIALKPIHIMDEESTRFAINRRDGEDGASEVVATYRLPIRPSITPGKSGELAIPRIKILNAVEAPTRYILTSISGLSIHIPTEQWQRIDSSSATGSDLTNTIAIVSSDGAAERILQLNLESLPNVKLPGAVASRAWIQTSVNNNSLRTTARYQISTRRPSLFFKLPDGHQNLSLQLAGQLVTKISQTMNPPGYQLDIPADQLTRVPFVLEIDYTVPTADAVAPWSPPELIDTSTQQTIWDIDLPRTSVVVNLPAGYSDESSLDWGLLQGLIGRSARDDRSIRAWFGSGTGLSNYSINRNSQRIVLSRADAPVPIKLRTVSRIMLFAIISALSLGMSLVVLVGHFRHITICIIITVIGYTLSLLLDTRLFYVFFESTTLGIALGFIAYITQRIVERRRSELGIMQSARTHPPIHPQTSTADYRPVGSDDSTAIRIRPPGSTSTRIPAAPSNEDPQTPGISI